MDEQQHDQHMQKMIDGINMILQSSNIDEIHQIAQNLLQEEQQEEEAPPTEEETSNPSPVPEKKSFGRSVSNFYMGQKK